ncbi:MAG: hypothetical protein H6929_20030 [Rhodoferax sp.]|nr:hypothetical protein [Rhodoferax sp.]
MAASNTRLSFRRSVASQCRVGVVAATALLFSGCATQSNEMTGQQIGILLGAIIGAAIGNNNSADFAGAVIGGAIGGAIGSNIGKGLDERDRLKAQSAALAAVRQPEPSTVTWKSDNNPGVSGVVTTVPLPARAPLPAVATAAAPSQNGSGLTSGAQSSSSSPSAVPQSAAGNCKLVTHLISINGREQKEENRMCRQPDGSWQLV